MENGKRVVIVGSGLGGLVCGAILAREGYHVTVVDMNKQIGGNLQTFVRDRHIFDSGIHYVGGLDKGQNLHRIFQYLGILDKLRLRKMDERGFDRIYFYTDNKEYVYAQGYPAFVDSLVKDFPDERAAIEKYCDVIRMVCAKVPLYNLRAGTYFEHAPFLETSTKSFIQTLTENTRLQNVLAGNNPLYAGEGDKTPLYVHALVLNSYIESSWRFVNGGSQMAKQLSKVIRDHGGEIRNRTEIKDFHVEGDVVDYVQSVTGEKFEGDIFISNIHPAKTLEMTHTSRFRPAYRHRVEQLENSISAFVMNITLKPGMFKYQNTNYYCYTQDDVWSCMDYTEETWPHTYAMFFSEFEGVEEYAEGITIMTYMRYSEVEQWKDTYNTALKPAGRGESYEEFKRQKAETLLDLAERKFPGLRASIKSYYTATPLTFRDYMGTSDGSIYGITKDYKDPLRTFISPKTKLDNLLFTGQNVNLHGVLGVTVSALVTCSTLLGLPYLVNRIQDADEK